MPVCNRVGEIFSPLSHHQYVPFDIWWFNVTSSVTLAIIAEIAY